MTDDGLRWWNLLFCSDNATVEQPVQEMVEFMIIYNKQKYEIKFALDETVDALKNHIEKLTGNHNLFVSYRSELHRSFF